MSFAKDTRMALAALVANTSGVGRAVSAGSPTPFATGWPLGFRPMEWRHRSRVWRGLEQDVRPAAGVVAGAAADAWGPLAGVSGAVSGKWRVRGADVRLRTWRVAQRSNPTKSADYETNRMCRKVLLHNVLQAC
jgi:hypothetical protein